MNAINSPEKTESFSHFLNDLIEVFDIPRRKRRELEKLIFPNEVPPVKTAKPKENTRKSSTDVAK